MRQYGKFRNKKSYEKEIVHILRRIKDIEKEIVWIFKERQEVERPVTRWPPLAMRFGSPEVK